jgi:hypothetical protein
MARKVNRLPKRLSVGAKYVVEKNGRPFVPHHDTSVNVVEAPPAVSKIKGGIAHFVTAKVRDK